MRGNSAVTAELTAHNDGSYQGSVTVIDSDTGLKKTVKGPDSRDQNGNKLKGPITVTVNNADEVEFNLDIELEQPLTMP